MFIAKARLVMLLAALLTPQIAGEPTQAQQDGAQASPTPASSAAPRQKGYPNLKAQAEQWAEAYRKKDYGKVASLTFPKQVELMGGPEEMARTLSLRLKRNGEKMLSVKVGKPGEVTPIGRQLFAVVPIKLRMEVPPGILTGPGFLIGISDDDGETWTFIDCSRGRDDEMVKTLIPAAAGKLTLPEPKQFVLETKS